MRISDWSSDVCSSDLRRRRRDGGYCCLHRRRRGFGRRRLVRLRTGAQNGQQTHSEKITQLHFRLRKRTIRPPTWQIRRRAHHAGAKKMEIAVARSEEHTSELQSLMRISYAVFCLKKKQLSPHLQLTQQNKTSQHK